MIIIRIKYNILCQKQLKDTFPKYRIIQAQIDK